MAYTTIKHLKILLFIVIILFGILSAYYILFLKPKVLFVGKPVNSDFYLSEKEIKQLTKKGNADSAYKLSLYYEKIKNDNINALKWLTRAAELDHSVAQQNLAFYFENNHQNKNYNKAIYWYKRSAEHGNNSSSQYNLGEMYKNGKGVKVDLIQAKYWYQKAALSGDVLAITDLSEILIEKDLINKNIEEAYAWNLIAKEITSSTSYKNTKIERINMLLELMSPDEIKTANKLSVEIKTKIGCVIVFDKDVGKICWDSSGKSISN